MNYAAFGLLTDLHDPVDRAKLAGKRVQYRVRWAPDELRAGTVSRVKASTLFIGAACLHHDDLVSLVEVP